MNGNGITFNDMSPIMDGTWYNPTTGDSFTVRDTMFEDNNLIVLTTDGRQIGYDRIQHYIKSDKPIPRQQPAAQQAVTDIPPEVASIIDNDNDMLPEDAALISGINQQSISIGQSNPAQSASTIKDENIIVRALGTASQPDIDFKIKWADIPVREMDMLVNVMKCDINDIVSWQLSKINTQDLLNDIKDSISKHIKTELDKYTKASKK